MSNEKPNDLNDLFNLKQAAEYIGFKACTLRTWRYTQPGVLKFIKIGRKDFYHKKDLDSFLAMRLAAGKGPRIKKDTKEIEEKKERKERVLKIEKTVISPFERALIRRQEEQELREFFRQNFDHGGIL